MGSALFAAHMTQHEVLMLLAAPLLVLGRPLAPFLMALPVNLRRFLIKAGKLSGIRRIWRWSLSPLVAWLFHAAVLWMWHLPSLFQLTLENEYIHAAQHLSFLLSALIFSEALIYGHGNNDARMGYGAAVIYIFTTAIHTSALGALLTFANSVWYPIYDGTTSAWGLTPLEDQQLGGLIMWVPAGLIYVAVGLLLLAAMIRESERRVLRGEKRFGM
jgi:putative membrane protein